MGSGLQPAALQPPSRLCQVGPGRGRPGAGLTEVQPVPGELPLAGIVGQVFALLLQGHLPRVHDDGQVAGLDVCVGWLGGWGGVQRWLGRM